MSDFVETNYGEGGDTDFMSGSMDSPTTTFQGKYPNRIKPRKPSKEHFNYTEKGFYTAFFGRNNSEWFILYFLFHPKIFHPPWSSFLSGVDLISKKGL